MFAGQGPRRVRWAPAAAAMWAAYLLPGKRVTGGGNGLDDRAVGFAVVAVVLAPVLVVGQGAGLAALADPLVQVAVVRGGVLSGVVPSVLEQLVLRRVGHARFAVPARLPATVTLVGLVGLGHPPSLPEGVGIVVVAGAVAVRSRDGVRRNRWADRDRSHAPSLVGRHFP